MPELHAIQCCGIQTSGISIWIRTRIGTGIRVRVGHGLALPESWQPHLYQFHTSFMVYRYIWKMGNMPVQAVMTATGSASALASAMAWHCQNADAEGFAVI